MTFCFDRAPKRTVKALDAGSVGIILGFREEAVSVATRAVRKAALPPLAVVLRIHDWAFGDGAKHGGRVPHRVTPTPTELLADHTAITPVPAPDQCRA